MRTRINVTFTAGTRSISTGIAALTIPDIRLIVNETQKVVVASSMQKDNIASIANGVITYADTIPALAAGDVMTVEIDQTGTFPTDYAKQGSNANATNTAILAAIPTNPLIVEISSSEITNMVNRIKAR